MANIIDRLYRDKRKAELNSNWKEAAALCNCIGVELCRLGKFEEALQSHVEELELCSMLNDELGKAVANRRIGECCCELSRFEDALKHHKMFLSIAVKQGSLVEEQRAWATIGRTYYLRYLHRAESSGPIESAQSSLEKAERSFLKALELADCLKSQISTKEFAEMRSRLLLNIGLLYVQRGDLSKCAASICSAIFLTKKFQLYEDLYRCQFSLASVYQRCERYNHALRLFDDSIATAKLLHDKALQCESFVAKANVLLYLKDFTGVKTYLKKAYWLHSPVSADHERTAKQLKIAVNICNCSSQLTKTTDLAERKLLCEKIGDGLASLECFKLAIEYYLLALECLELMNVPAEDKAPMYYSLAQTYADDGNYEQAVKYFRIEIQCNHSKPEEQIKTMWKVADIKDEQNSYTEAEQILLEALKISKLVGKSRNIICSLKKLESHYSASCEPVKLDEISRALSQIAERDNISFDDECDVAESEELICDVDLNELSSDTDSDVEKEVKGKKRQRTKYHKSKRNELGETPLHRACISGNLKLVKHLIETGHPINPRDNCGWLPLHEACNHGFLEIVEYLLSKGAWINDRGGKLCEGITPLHDAASCGNIEVMELLLSKGASVTALNDQGESPLDCLVKWWQRSKDDMDCDVACRFKEIEKRLKGLMKQAGQTVETDGLSWSVVNDYDEKRNFSSDKRVLSSDSSNTSDDESVEYENPDLNPRNYCKSFNDPETIQLQYEATISSFRRSAASAVVRLSGPDLSSSKALPALLDESEVVEDWLIPDSGRKFYKQQRKKHCKSREPQFHQLHHAVDSKRNQRNKISNIHSAKSKSDEKNIEDGLFAVLDTNDNSVAVQSAKYGASNGIMQNHMFCLRVQICDKVILVPVPDHKATIGWLAEEAARRYYDIMGSKPHLSLMNEDGALLSYMDLIKNVLQHNEKIITNIERWGKTSPLEHYKQYCNKNNIPISETVLNKFLNLETSSELDFADIILPSAHVNAVLTCVSRDDVIQSLNFSHVDMDDSCMQQLVRAIPILVSISSIKLCCCGLTSKSVKEIAKCLTDSEPSVKYLQKLRHLDLSYNNFGPESSCSFAIVLDTVPLETLNLSTCNLTKSFFLNKTFCQALLSKQNFSEFNVSGNILNKVGVSELLSSLSSESLTKLDFSMCFSERTEFDFLAIFLSHDKMLSLTELQLSGCYLCDSDIAQLTKGIRHCPRLVLCNVSANPGLSIGCLSELIKKAHQYEIPLCSFYIIGCFLWKTESVEHFIKLIHYKCLSRILVDKVPASFKDMIFDTWKEVWGRKGVCLNNVICELMVKSVTAE